MTSLIWACQRTSHDRRGRDHHVGKCSVCLSGGPSYGGIMGDKKGRLSVLLVPSCFILWPISPMVLWRMFLNISWYVSFAGLGLTGELDAGITLVSELVSKKGAWQHPLWQGIGLTGAVVAFIIRRKFQLAGLLFHRRWIGTGFITVTDIRFESGMFHGNKKADVRRGTSLIFVYQGANGSKRYFLNIMIGLPYLVCDRRIGDLPGEFGENSVSRKNRSRESHHVRLCGHLHWRYPDQAHQPMAPQPQKALFIFLRHHGIIPSPVLYHSVEQFSNRIILDLLQGLDSAPASGPFVTMAAERQFSTKPCHRRNHHLTWFVACWPYSSLAFVPGLRNYTDYISARWISAIIIMLITMVAAAMVEKTFGRTWNYTETGSFILPKYLSYDFHPSAISFSHHRYFAA